MLCEGVLCSLMAFNFGKILFHFFRDALRKGGSVVDAAVAAMFCNGVLDQPHIGLGGGTVMTIYER